MYLFFGVAPVLQYKSSTYFFGVNSVINETDMYYGGLLSLTIIIFHNLMYYFISTKKLTPEIKFPTKRLEVNFDFKIVSSVLIILLSLFVVTIFFDFESFISARYLKGLKGYKFYAINFFRDTLRLIPLFYLLNFKQGKVKDLRVEIVLILSILLFNFPTAISRFQVALVYLPLFYFYFKKLQEYFVLVFLSSFLLIFPYLHNFRYSLKLQRDNYNFFGMFNSLHFDTFQNTISVIKLSIITNGEQLFGSLLFFIPRSIWAEKSRTSSLLLCNEIEFDGFCNIALSFFGEGYINFGYVGLTLFLLFLAYFNAFFDKTYLNYNSSSFNSFYFIFIFYEFYLLRGSLTSSIQKLLIIILALNLLLLINYIMSYKKYTFN
ncbi:hypothetical protein [Algibacter aquimarinus]